MSPDTAGNKRKCCRHPLVLDHTLSAFAGNANNSNLLLLSRPKHAHTTSTSSMKTRTSVDRIMPDWELNELAVLLDQFLQLLLICKLIGIFFEVQGNPCTPLQRLCTVILPHLCYQYTLCTGIYTLCTGTFTLYTGIYKLFTTI